MLAGTRQSGRLLRRPTWPFALDTESDRAKGLVGWFPHWTPGIVPDVSVYGKSRGTLSGTTKPIAGPTPFGGSAAKFAGGASLASYYNCGTPLGPQDMTLASGGCAWAFWVYLTALGGGIAEKNDNDGTAGWEIGTNATGSKIAISFPASSGDFEAEYTAPALNGWHRMLFSYNGGSLSVQANMSAFLDGVGASFISGTTSSGSQTTDAAQTLRLGNAQYTSGGGGISSGAMTGYLADFCIWKGRQFTAAQAWADFDPKTRWDLYYKPRRTVWFTSASATSSPYGWEGDENTQFARQRRESLFVVPRA